MTSSWRWCADGRERRVRGLSAMDQLSIAYDVGPTQVRHAVEQAAGETGFDGLVIGATRARVRSPKIGLYLKSGTRPENLKNVSPRRSIFSRAPR